MFCQTCGHRTPTFFGWRSNCLAAHNPGVSFSCSCPSSSVPSQEASLSPSFGSGGGWRSSSPWMAAGGHSCRVGRLTKLWSCLSLRFQPLSSTGQLGLPNVRAYTAVIRSQGGLSVGSFKKWKAVCVRIFFALNNPWRFLSIFWWFFYYKSERIVYIYGTYAWCMSLLTWAGAENFLPFQVDNGNWPCRC